MGEQTQSSRITTVVIEDEQKIRQIICDKITAADGDFEIVGQAANGQEAVLLVEKLRPQVIFTDICMPVMDGMELIKMVRQLSPKTVVVIVSGYSDFSYAQQAIKHGVFNYLLKPIEDDVLLELLLDIKKSLSYSAIKQQRNIIYSEGYQVISKEREQFALAVVCIGNVIYSTQEEVIQYYSRRMERIPWTRMMEQQFGQGAWFVADDHERNQKIIAVKLVRGEDTLLAEFAGRLMEALEAESDLGVTVCCGKLPVDQGELWNEVKLLRDIIRRRLVIGESHIFYGEEQGFNNHMLDIIKMKLNTFAKNNFFRIGFEDFFEDFMEEIRVIFKYMKNNHVPQASIEKAVVYMLRLLEMSNQGYDRQRLEELQSRMMKSISMENQEERLFEELLHLFGTVNGERESEEKTDIEEILAYIDEHYLTIESMEEVAEEFGYNYTYLSRMFKNKAGESMSRYILNKKLDLAREMLCTRPELKVTEISDLCGYNDYRYFGRVFKNEVGLSPSEYREQEAAAREKTEE